MQTRNYVGMPDQNTRANRLYILGAILLVASLALQFSWFPITTSDYTAFVQQWFNTLQTNSGLSAFTMQFSDYAPLYLYILKLLTFIPVNSLYSSKFLSVLANALIAALAILIARDTVSRSYGKAQLFLIFSLFLCVPTLMVNASLWGQSDALYAAPVVAAFYFLLRDKPLLASLLFGIAVSIKIQAIFFLPVLLGYLLQSKRKSLYILVPPAVFLLTVLPTATSSNFFYWLLIYTKQAGEYPYLSVSSPSIFAFVNNLPLSGTMQDLLFWVGILLALACGAWVAYIARKTPPSAASTIAYLSFLSVLILPYLLPRMHERYFFLADVFACLYVLFEPRKWYLAALVVLSSLLSYMPYLSSQVASLSFAQVDLRIPAALLLVTLCCMVALLRHMLYPAYGKRA